MMNTDCLKHLPTPDQLEQFREEGYLILRDVLSPDIVSKLLEVSDKIDTRHRQYSQIDSSTRVSLFDIFERHEIFVELIDNPRILPLIWTLLGDAIQVYFSQLVIYPPEGANPKPQQGLHRDGVSPRTDLERERIWPQPMLSLKTAFWLEPCPTPEHGAIRLIPRSHKIRDERQCPEMKHLCVNAGDVTIHDRRVIHSRGHNTSDAVRKTIFIGYSYRWLRLLGEGFVPERVIDACSPIRKQLLGAPCGWNSYWEPEITEPLPLRSWLKSHDLI